MKLVGIAGGREQQVPRGEIEGIAAVGGAIDSDHDIASHVVRYLLAQFI